MSLKGFLLRVLIQMCFPCFAFLMIYQNGGVFNQQNKTKQKPLFCGVIVVPHIYFHVLKALKFSRFLPWYTGYATVTPLGSF